MTAIEFQWDQKKAESNKRKHGVTFEEAKAVFYDESALLMDDPDHSEGESRFIMLGLSSALRVLVVVHCYRTSQEIIRIISARKATQAEQNVYARVAR